MASCRAQFTPRLGWQYRFWTAGDVEALIRKHRPAYLKVGWSGLAGSHRRPHHVLPHAPPARCHGVRQTCVRVSRLTADLSRVRQAGAAHRRRQVGRPGGRGAGVQQRCRQERGGQPPSPRPAGACYCTVAPPHSARRYLVLQHVGGLYLDSDVECFRESYDALEGADLVVQVRAQAGCRGWLPTTCPHTGAPAACTAAGRRRARACPRCGAPAPLLLQEDYPGAAVNSGVLACRPNHPAWERAFEIMHERKGAACLLAGLAGAPRGAGRGLAGARGAAPSRGAASAARPHRQTMTPMTRATPLGPRWCATCSCGTTTCPWVRAPAQLRRSGPAGLQHRGAAHPRHPSPPSGGAALAPCRAQRAAAAAAHAPRRRRDARLAARLLVHTLRLRLG